MFTWHLPSPPLSLTPPFSPPSGQGRHMGEGWACVAPQWVQAGGPWREMEVEPQVAEVMDSC